jgi:hypothetical protein
VRGGVQPGGLGAAFRAASDRANVSGCRPRDAFPIFSTPRPVRASPDVAARRASCRIGLARAGGALTTLALAVCFVCRAQAEPPVDDGLFPTGPEEIRDEHLFAQPRLTLPPVSPHLNGAGRWTLRIAALCSNSFSWRQDAPGEQPAVRQYLIDGEALSLDATVRRGLTRDLDVGLRIPVRSRGGGMLDGMIDAWHGFFHLPDDHRPEFRRDAFRMEGVTQDERPFSWTHRSGWGLGDAELETRWRLRDGGRSGASVAVVARVSLPTGSGPFAGNGAGAGAQLVTSLPLDAHAWLYAGVGTTLQGRGPVAGVAYAPQRIHGFLAVEWRPWRRFSFVAETDAASRLVTNVEGYPGIHWILNVTGRIQLDRRSRIDLGFTENVMDQRSTTDFGLHLALVLRP